MASGSKDCLIRVKAALAHTYAARRILVNPVSAFVFFLKGQGGSTEADPGRFHLGRMQFYARFKDWNAVQEVALEREYAFVEAVLKNRPSSTVVDLGANIGLFSMYVLLMDPSTIVHSLEPSQSTYQVLEHNRSANLGLNWHTYRYAVWKADGEVPFENRDYSTSSRIGLNGIGDEVVPAISLATLLARHVRTPVDLMKVDIEGAEEAVLCGSEPALQNVDHLVVEVHPQLCNQDRVVATLRSVYDFLYQIPGRRSSKPLLLASHQPYLFPDYRPV
jgi:FkbM family methyltransferase